MKSLVQNFKKKLRVKQNWNISILNMRFLQIYFRWKFIFHLWSNFVSYRAIATRELSKVLKDQVLRIDEAVLAGMLYNTKIVANFKEDMYYHQYTNT